MVVIVTLLSSLSSNPQRGMSLFLLLRSSITFFNNILLFLMYKSCTSLVTFFSSGILLFLRILQMELFYYFHFWNSHSSIQKCNQFFKLNYRNIRDLGLIPGSGGYPGGGHGNSHQIVNTKIRLITYFAAKDGETLYSQQKQDCEITVAQIMNSQLPNSDLN